MASIHSARAVGGSTGGKPKHRACRAVAAHFHCGGLDHYPHTLVRAFPSSWGACLCRMSELTRITARFAPTFRKTPRRTPRYLARDDPTCALSSPGSFGRHSEGVPEDWQFSTIASRSLHLIRHRSSSVGATLRKCAWSFLTGEMSLSISSSSRRSLNSPRNRCQACRHIITWPSWPK